MSKYPLTRCETCKHRSDCDPTPEPEIEQWEEWDEDGGCEAVDGCWVEPDGHCEHGCPSWLIVMGLI